MPAERIALSSRSTPVPSVSAVYSDISNDTLTWLCAPRLYSSSGLTELTISKQFDESVRSP